MNNLLNEIYSLKTLSDEERFTSHIRQWFPISLVIGFVVGIAMALFAIFSAVLADILSFMNSIGIMVVGGLFIIFLVWIKFENPDENGISYVITKKHAQEVIPAKKIKKFLSSGVATATGFPMGREGPSLIIGSAIAGWIAKIFHVNEREAYHVITIGSAAATGALFQAPFGSAVFAAEVPYKEDADEPMLISSFLASVIAAVTTRTIIQQFSHIYYIDLFEFKIGNAFLELNFVNTFLAFLLGTLIGIMGFGIIKFYYFYQKRIEKLTHLPRISVGISLMILLVMISYLFIPNLFIVKGIPSFFMIHQFIREASETMLLFLVIVIIVQVLSTTFIIAAGFPGGIFAPMLSVGAIFGIIFAILLGNYDPLVITAYAIIGMSASHAATTKTPIASVLLILEISGLPDLVVVMVVANLAAYIMSGSNSLYKGQIHSRDLKIMRQLRSYDQLRQIRVSDVMTPFSKLIYTSSEAKLAEFRQIVINTRKRTFPVIDNDKLVGIISLDDINFGIEQNKILVKEAMTRDVVTLKPQDTGTQAMYKFLDKDVERCPVVEGKKVVGIATIKDILRGHRKQIADNTNM